MAFAVRYDDIRCMPIEKFPYLIHYRFGRVDTRKAREEAFSTEERYELRLEESLPLLTKNRPTC